MPLNSAVDNSAVAGERWICKESRRVVRIDRVESGFVYYRNENGFFPRETRSRQGRFIKAFKRAESWER